MTTKTKETTPESYLSKNISLTVRVLLPTDHVIGTGPDDDNGIPSVTRADYEQAQQESLAGQRAVFAKVEMFPDAKTLSYVTPLSTDVVALVKEAVSYLTGELNKAICEEAEETFLHTTSKEDRDHE